MQIIIFKRLDDGGLSLMVPVEAGQPIEYFFKDVPVGCKYKVYEDTDLPTDLMFFDAWDADTTDWDTKEEPIDGVR